MTTAIGAAVERARLVGSDVTRLLVACDTGVGAQDLNLARRAALAMGWSGVPALTVDGHGSAGLGLLDLAMSLDGVTVVAGVDASSMVPPGAGLVRDYGRPTLDEPELGVEAERHLVPRPEVDLETELGRRGRPIAGEALDLGVQRAADAAAAE